MDEPTNILVVDDLPEKLLVYRTILEDLGQNLVMVGSGEEALRAVLNNDFAVILLDVKMPGMSGFETAAMIRRRKRSAHTPIIFVTAFSDEVRAAEGYEQGAVDYITTPVVPGVLRAKVRVFADLYRMTQQARRQAEERVALAEERTRRVAAEEANQRLTLLARAGEVIGQSLEVEVTARDVIRLATPALADAAALVFPAEAGRPARCLRGRGGEGAGEPEAWPGPEAELLAPVERALAQGVIAHDGPALAIPLRAQGRTFAALGLSRAASGRPFAAPDLTFADAYASRAAVALENARLYQEVQQADRQKNEFLSMLAHELRNPLAPIRNANEVLRRGGADPASLGWAQGVIDRQLTHLVRLVDDLLDVSRLTLGKIRLVAEPVDLAAVVEQAVEAVRPLIAQAGHRLTVSLPPGPAVVDGDKDRLTQVLTNLLNNAVKYSDPGALIALAVEVEAPAGGPEPAAVVRVRDTGIGIPADLLPRVFDLFAQANRSLDRSQGGLGIGLTLVRRLVEMHGGTVEARSPGPGLGSEFVVRLPVAPVPAVAPAAGRGAEAPPAAEPLRIVLIDDNVDAAESLASLLELIGHSVRTAHDGPAGIEAVRAFDPDVVLLDIGLPRMDGYEVARQLRREPGHRAVLAAVSGYGRDEDRQRGREAGFQQHFVKPVDFGALRAFFAALCASRRA